jgi:hypothetical protein
MTNVVGKRNSGCAPLPGTSRIRESAARWASSGIAVDQGVDGLVMVRGVFRRIGQRSRLSDGNESSAAAVRSVTGDDVRFGRVMVRARKSMVHHRGS